MVDLLKWLLLFTITGFLVFPLTFSMFRHLRTRGYGLSKVFALLIWGYVFWLSNIFGLVSNTHNGVTLILLIVFGTSVYVFLQNKSAISIWIRSNRTTILSSELLFMVAIVTMLVLRLPNPEIIGTEKPMELAFLNGIYQTAFLPPQDPWLSGYSISYYYFGYLLLNLPVKLLSTSTGVAFNLGLIFWFGMIAQASADFLYNLLSNRNIIHEKSREGNKKPFLFLASLLAPLFILVLSNSEGFLELLHSLGVFWRTGTTLAAKSQFWTWMDIKELVDPPSLPLDWNIYRPGATWWWRASRVLQDYTLLGQSREIINEFPFFSFFLGDLHPHLLAAPFVMLSISASFELLQREITLEFTSFRQTLRSFFHFDYFQIALITGSLVFLNTWDFPIYFGLITLVVVYKSWLRKGNIFTAIRAALPLIISLGIISVSLFTPFLIAFSSQAGGVLPSLIFQSRSIHQLVMFLPLLPPIIFYIFIYMLSSVKLQNLIRIFFIFTAILIIGLLLSIGYAILIVKAPDIIQYLGNLFGNPAPANLLASRQNADGFLGIYQAASLSELILTTARKISADPWMKMLFIFFLSAPFAFILRNQKPSQKNIEIANKDFSDVFFGLLLIIASILILFPEVFYLRDQFGWRMNTIFKFYFQAWIVLSICAAYALVQLLTNIKGWKRNVIGSISLFAVLTGLIYPAFGFKERMEGFRWNDISLDGVAYFARNNPDEMEAVLFIRDAGCGVISEAVGGSYSNYARISRLTGCQTVLGWPGHELQWRGSADLLGSRETDIRTLYTTNDWLSAYGVINAYEIEYVFIGDLERATYAVNEEKFLNNMAVVFQNDSVVIYGWMEHGNLAQ